MKHQPVYNNNGAMTPLFRGNRRVHLTLLRSAGEVHRGVAMDTVINNQETDNENEGGLFEICPF